MPVNVTRAKSRFLQYPSSPTLLDCVVTKIADLEPDHPNKEEGIGNSEVLYCEDKTSMVALP